MTDDERERRIRVRNARHATPDCLCDWCFILGRLDAERKRGAETEALAAEDEHPVVFAGSVSGPIYCATCKHTIVLDGYPERVDGEWIHLSDWRRKHQPTEDDQ